MPGFPLEEILIYMMNYTSFRITISSLSCVVSIGKPLHFYTRFALSKFVFSWSFPGIMFHVMLYSSTRDRLEPHRFSEGVDNTQNLVCLTRRCACIIFGSIFWKTFHLVNKFK
ncbi:hypothetical protein H5410_054093 [Solanum commersonii]|uniref:Uncharacterized protein n=1 Tax=Solanum commersonii TaxID=4109 RepID=A0A9J5X6G2_SOLCO|nr:hypothetical protein H5410_054093 [Solanum commersonii]